MTDVYTDTFLNIFENFKLSI